MIEVEVPAALAGERIDRVVALITDLSRARAAELVQSASVALDGATVAQNSARVRPGQALAIDWEPTAADRSLQPDPAVVVPVVWSDDDVLVVDKPAGLVVHPGSGVRTSTLAHGLLAAFPELAGVGEPERPGIVHRLDRGTSGLMVVARSALAYEGLVGQLASHEVQRTYRALVSGTVASTAGLIDAPIGPSRQHPTRRAVRHDGKEARTRYRVETRFSEPEEATLVTCELETGRTHQIRVHLHAVGHPVVGDSQYGGRTPVGLPLARPFLHAVRLAFEHPCSGEPLAFESPLPADLVEALARFS